MGCARRNWQGYRCLGGRVDLRATRLGNRPGRESAQKHWFQLAGLDQHLAQRQIARVQDPA